MKVEIDIQKPGQETFGGELRPQSLLDQVFESRGFERRTSSSSRHQLRSIEIDDDRQSQILDLRPQPSLRGQKPELYRRDRADLHASYLDRRPDFEAVQVSLEHADEADRLGEHATRADYDQRHYQDRKAGDHECADDGGTDAFSHYCLPSRLLPARV